MSRLRGLLAQPRVQHALVVVLSAALLLPNVGMGLWDPWETHYAEVARRMGVHGDWITLRWHSDSRLADDVNGRCRADPDECTFFSKPALIFWMMGISFRVLGVNDAAARLPFVLVGIAGLFGVYWYLRRTLGLEAGLLSAAVLATTPYYYLLSRQIMTDIAFVVPMTVGLLGLVHFLLDEERARPRHLYLFYAMIGLATLAKGLLGFLLPGAIVFVYMMLEPGRLVASLRRLHIERGALIFLSVAGPWYGAVYAVNGRVWLMEFIVKHHFRRVGEGVHGERGTFEYFVEQLGFGLWPWVALVPLALGAAWIGSRRASSAGSKLPTFLVIWAAVAFGLFTISTTKFHHYIFPAVPAMAMLVAVTLLRFLEERSVRPMEKALLLVGAALVLAITPVLVREPFRFINLITYKYDLRFPDVASSGYFLGAAVAVFCLGVVLLLARRLVVAAPLVLFVGASIAAGWYVQGYMIAQENTMSQRDAWEAYHRLRRPGDRLYEWALRWRGEVWYSRDSSHEIPQRSTARMRRELGRPGRAFIGTTSPEPLNDQLRRLFGRTARIVNDDPHRYAMTLWEGPPAGRVEQHLVRELPRGAVEVNATLGDGVELLAYQIRPASVGPDRPVQVTLFFRTSRRIDREWTVFVHCDHASGDRRHRLLSDHPPADGVVPTTSWQPGQIVRDESEVMTRRNQPAGTYRFYAGLFRDEGRMPVRSGPNDGDDRVELGTIEVTR
jgi:4-amino-4-deoxy-L-arabinose transferase-like glycosyltransferase